MNPTNNDILKSWLIQSLTPPPPPTRPPSPPRTRRTLPAPTLKFIGDEYWVASLSSASGVCRRISQDKGEAIHHCQMLFRGR
jgi:hypothetical protein